MVSSIPGLVLSPVMPTEGNNLWIKPAEADMYERVRAQRVGTYAIAHTDDFSSEGHNVSCSML